MSCGGEPLRDFLIAYRKEERGIQVQSERRARGETVARDYLDGRPRAAGQAPCASNLDPSNVSDR
jgi:hypothetical protein